MMNPNTNDLQQVINKLLQDPSVLQTGVKQGAYSVTAGKIWRGTTVIGYAAQSPVEGTKVELLPTSQTTPAEHAIMKRPAPEAPAETPPMTVNSPEGQQAEAPEPQQPQSQPGQQTKVPLSKNGNKQESVEEILRVDETYNPKDLLKQDRIVVYPEDYQALNEHRLIETRRKYIKASASIEFDIEAKRVTGGEWIRLYLLPVVRSEGKYELYSHCVTRECHIPSAHKVEQEVSKEIKEKLTHANLNPRQLMQLGRRIHSMMRAAKDVLGGSPVQSESIEREIETYLAEF